MNDWQEWAIFDKADVYEIAQKYSGSFVKALVEAYMRADVVNSRKILTNWPAEFAQLYEFKKKER